MYLRNKKISSVCVQFHTAAGRREAVCVVLTLGHPGRHLGDVDAAVVDAARGQGNRATRPSPGPLPLGHRHGASLTCAAQVRDLRQAVHGHEDTCT